MGLFSQIAGAQLESKPISSHTVDNLAFSPLEHCPVKSFHGSGWEIPNQLDRHLGRN